MHFLAFLTVALMTVFATVMALPREPDAKLAQSAADEYDQSRGFVNSIEPSLSASPEGSEYVAGDIEFDEDHPARKLIPRGGECSYGHRFCGECNGTSCKMAYVNLPCRKGTCVKQRGGGDGSYCGGPRTGSMICPGW